MAEQVTPDKLRLAAADAELRGNWEQVELFNAAADRLISLEAQNQAYRHSLQNGVSINLPETITVNRRPWFRRR